MTMQLVGRRLFAPVDPSDVSETRPRATIRPSIGRSVGRSVRPSRVANSRLRVSLSLSVVRRLGWMRGGSLTVHEP